MAKKTQDTFKVTVQFVHKIYYEGTVELSRGDCDPNELDMELVESAIQEAGMDSFESASEEIDIENTDVDG